MALTAKPMSTISYNSIEFVERKMTELFDAQIVEDYRFIKHIGEDGDKDHIHMIIYPNKRIDTAKLREEFKEVIATEEKPLGCMPFRSSKPEHWLMYVLHDSLYLQSHNADSEDGKIEYSLEEIKTPFPEQLERDYKKAIQLRQTEQQKVIDALAQGLTGTDIIYSMNINAHLVTAIKKLVKEEYISDRAIKKSSEELERLRRLDGVYYENRVISSVQNNLVKHTYNGEEVIEVDYHQPFDLDEHGSLNEERMNRKFTDAIRQDKKNA